MGRLDELDLSLSLSREDYEKRLTAAQRRLAALRLALGGKLPGYEGTLGPALPGLGGMTVFDRSWYGRVLVERVDQLATREEWERAYSTITEFERSFCEEGGVRVKFWLHVSEEEQLKRFQEREGNPLKRWKLTDDDWKNRAKRPLYGEALEEMFERTDHERGPWRLVEAESKRYARVKVIETVNAEIERGMRERGFPVP